MRRRGFLGVTVIVMLAASAEAAVLAEDELEETSTEVGIVGRSFAFVLFGEPLPAPVGLGLLDLRLYTIKRTPNWKFVVHNQLTTTVRSQDLLGFGLVGRGLPPPRLLPLQQDIVDEPTLSVRNVTDWLYVTYTGATFSLTVGRQPVTFGRGKLWSPYDLIGTFSLTEVDTEYKPGADAVRADWTPSEKTNVSVVAATGEFEDDNDVAASLRGTSIVARGKTTLDGGEAGVFAGYIRGDAVVGVDGVYDAGSFELYSEATLTRASGTSLVSPEVDSGELAVKAILGATFRPVSKTTVSLELMGNGFGASNESGYLPLAFSDRVAVGEQIFLGRYYIGAAASWEVHPLLHIVGATIVNMRDPSALASAGLSYSVADNAQAVLGGYAPIGKDGTEYGSAPLFLYFELKAIL